MADEKWAGNVGKRFDDSYIPEPMSGCWLWIKFCNYSGYGFMGVEGKVLRAHRVSWEIHNGAIPSGLVVCHKCDTPSCVNPNHLFVGTQKDNSQDMIAKNRHRPELRGLYRKNQTHCKYGHEYTEANTRYTDGGKHRECKTCISSRRKKYRAQEAMHG